MHTGVLSHRETSGWTALVGDSPAGCQVRPTADAVAATGTAALFDHRVLLLVAKCGFKRPAPLVVPAFFVGTSDTWLSTKVFSLIKMVLLAGRILLGVDLVCTALRAGDYTHHGWVLVP